jgi:hypothetical protein
VVICAITPIITVHEFGLACTRVGIAGVHGAEIEVIAGVWPEDALLSFAEVECTGVAILTIGFRVTAAIQRRRDALSIEARIGCTGIVVIAKDGFVVTTTFRITFVQSTGIPVIARVRTNLTLVVLAEIK